MLTFDQFRENKREDEEEKTGLDSDGDREKGESKGHKDKVDAKHKENIAFFEARKIGARKIASEARGKGTDASKLTAWHFSSKERPYNEVIQAIKANRPETFFSSKYRQALNRIKMKMKQESFQRYMGECEVWGEAYSQLFE